MAIGRRARMRSTMARIRLLACKRLRTSRLLAFASSSAYWCFSLAMISTNGRPRSEGGL